MPVSYIMFVYYIILVVWSYYKVPKMPAVPGMPGAPGTRKGPPGLQFVPEVWCRVLRGSMLGLAFWPSFSRSKTLILNFPVVLTLVILRGFPPHYKKRKRNCKENTNRQTQENKLRQTAIIGRGQMGSALMSPRRGRRADLCPMFMSFSRDVDVKMAH